MDQVKPRSPQLHGFSLVEMLVVIGIIAVLTTLGVTAFGTITKGSSMTRAGMMVGEQLGLARQEAATSNRDVEVRFYNVVSGPDAGWTAFQVWKVDQTPTGPVTRAHSGVFHLPLGVVIADSALSPLVKNSTRKGADTLGTQANTPYSAFRFRANGTLERQMSGDNYLTIVEKTETTQKPINYFTLQIHPLTGKTTAFRP